jgi:hypothetical protein
MNDGLVDLTANLLVVAAWLGCARFIWLYATRSPWRETLIGRTMMLGRVAMFTLLTFALVARWVEIPDLVRNSVALLIYASIALMEWRMAAVVDYAQKGNITIDNPNYTPIRDWFERHRRRRSRRS